MIFIVEGPDLAGKSTLINKLIKEFPGLQLKITDRPKDGSEKERFKIQDHYDQVIDFIIKHAQAMEDVGEQHYILDRFYPSEMCYSILRGYDAMDDQMLWKFEDFLIKYLPQHLLILCDPGVEELKSRHGVRGDEHVTHYQNELIHQRYQQFFQRTQLRKIKVDTTQPVEDVIKLIKDEYQGH